MVHFDITFQCECIGNSTIWKYCISKFLMTYPSFTDLLKITRLHPYPHMLSGALKHWYICKYYFFIRSVFLLSFSFIYIPRNFLLSLPFSTARVTLVINKLINHFLCYCHFKKWNKIIPHIPHKLSCISLPSLSHYITLSVSHAQ